LAVSDLNLGRELAISGFLDLDAVFASRHLHHEMAFIGGNPPLAIDGDLGAGRLHEDIQYAKPNSLGWPSDWNTPLKSSTTPA
jgi:hypothetical protein